MYDALAKEVRRRKLGDELRVHRIAHVGGHKWAANVLVYKNLGRGSDW